MLTKFWDMVYGARLDSKSRLPSEGDGVGSIPTTPTNISYEIYENNYL